MQDVILSVCSDVSEAPYAVRRRRDISVLDIRLMLVTHFPSQRVSLCAMREDAQAVVIGRAEDDALILSVAGVCDAAEPMLCLHRAMYSITKLPSVIQLEVAAHRGYHRRSNPRREQVSARSAAIHSPLPLTGLHKLLFQNKLAWFYGFEFERGFVAWFYGIILKFEFVFVEPSGYPCRIHNRETIRSSGSGVDV